MLIKYGAILAGAISLAACSEQATNTNSNKDTRTIERWYSPDMVQTGQKIFSQNCAQCHGKEAQGTILPWNKPLADGSYPPPPLNGSAHAWHHPLKGLVTTITLGGAPVGGKMPAFKDKLTIQERAAAVAFFQDYWTDEIYMAWLKRGGLN